MKNTDGIHLRRWGIDDWETFRAIRLEAVAAHSDVFLSNYDGEAAKDASYWQNTLADTWRGAVFGLYDGDTVIGLTGAFRHRDHVADTVIFGMSYIRADYRRLGLSGLLYAARIAWAREQEGITRIVVSHREGNDISRAANQNFGFVETGEKFIAFGNNETAREVMYELKL
jgi:RimJ/RimL family protein N-acetyltransferase